MLAAIHTSITGWDVVLALVVVLAALALDKVVPTVGWVGLATLFLAALLTFALLVST